MFQDCSQSCHFFLKTSIVVVTRIWFTRMVDPGYFDEKSTISGGYCETVCTKNIQNCSVTQAKEFGDLESVLERKSVELLVNMASLT